MQIAWLQRLHVLEVMFLGNGECLEISHKAMDRTHFSNGALQAAKRIIHQKPDLYNMDDVLV